MILPGITNVNIAARPFLLRSKANRTVIGEMIQVEESQVDDGAVAAGLPRDTILRPGTVLGKKTSDGLFYLADDVTNVTGSTVASATGLIAIDTGSANKTFKWKFKNGVEHTVTMGAGDDTCDEVVTKLNADALFSADLIADKVTTNKLRIRARRAGADEYFEITDGTINGQGGVAEDTFANNTTAGGTDGDYRVLGLGGGGHEDHLDMLGRDGAVATQSAPNLMAGEFDESELLHLTADAKAVLTRRGSFFG